MAPNGSVFSHRTFGASARSGGVRPRGQSTPPALISAADPPREGGDDSRAERTSRLRSELARFPRGAPEQGEGIASGEAAAAVVAAGEPAAPASGHGVAAAAPARDGLTTPTGDDDGEWTDVESGEERTLSEAEREIERMSERLQRARAGYEAALRAGRRDGRAVRHAIAAVAPLAIPVAGRQAAARHAAAAAAARIQAAEAAARFAASEAAVRLADPEEFAPPAASEAATRIAAATAAAPPAAAEAAVPFATAAEAAALPAAAAVAATSAAMDVIAYLKSVLGVPAEWKEHETVRNSCPPLELSPAERGGSADEFNRAMWALLGPDTSRYRVHLVACARAGAFPMSLSKLLNRHFETYSAVQRRIPGAKRWLETNDSAALLSCILQHVRQSVTFSMVPGAELSAKLLIRNVAGTPAGYWNALDELELDFNEMAREFESANPGCLDNVKLLASLVDSQPSGMRSFYDQVRDSNGLAKESSRGVAPVLRYLGYLRELADLRTVVLADRVTSPSMTPDPRYLAWLRSDQLFEVLTTATGTSAPRKRDSDGARWRG